MQGASRTKWVLANYAFAAVIGLAGCNAVVSSPGGSQGSGAHPGGTGASVGSGGGGVNAGSGGNSGTGNTGTGNAGTGSTVGNSGSGGGANIPGSGGAAAPAFAPAAGAYKRLTVSSFRNSVRDILGTVPAGELEQDSWEVGGLAAVGASVSSIGQSGVEDYQAAIETATTAVFANTAQRDKLLGCTPKNTTDTTCFRSFVTQFGRMAWRQSLTAAQIDRYTQLTSTNAATFADAYQGMRATMTALLLSPYFLYRLERGVSASPFWQYTSPEMASRLSYFLTNSTPDATLLDLADKNGLLTADAVRAQADRLLSTTQGRQSIGNFTTELLQLDIIAARAKDPALFPEYTTALQTAMIQEIPLMFQGLVFDQKASALDLFTTRSTYVNKDLASLYGLPTTGLTSGTMTAATLPATGARAGLLGAAGFLSLYASQKEGSPTQRGKFIREVLLCQAIPPPPNDVNTVLKDPDPGQVLTKKQRLEQHKNQPTCAACHALMDPVGLPLEVFDAIGKYRTTDQGLPIDTAGSLEGTDFMGPAALGQVVGKSPAAAACLVRSIYRYATGHVEVPAEAAVVNDLTNRFQASGYKLRDLMVDLVASDGFRYVATPTP